MPRVADTEQLYALGIIEYLLDLFTAASKEQFNRVDVLTILRRVTEDPELFDPNVLVAYQQATEDIV